MSKGSGNTLWDNQLIRMGISCVGIWFFFRYLFTLTAPFILAFLLITLCYPLLERMQRRVPIKKKFLAIGIILPLFLAAAGLLWAMVLFGVRQLEGLPVFCAQAGEQLELFFHNCCCGLDGKFGWDGQQIETYLIEQMTVVMENVQIQVVPQIISSSYDCFKGIFGAVGFLAITCIAAFLLEKEYVDLVESLKRSRELSLVWSVVEGVLSYIITFIKAQGVILLIISILCSAVLGIAGIPGGFLFGALAGFLDMLPFVGTGIVLVPLSLWQLLNGQYVRMIVCLILYGICIVTRELLEPKLIGKRIGIAPVFMLLAVYAGVKLFGVGGIIKGPLSLIVLYEIWKMDQQRFDENNRFDYDRI